MFFRKNKSQELQRWHVYVIVVILIFAFGYKLYQDVWPKAMVQIGGQELRVLVANNPLRRYTGWSNRKSMGNYAGMLFVFPERDQHTMVMRQMRFPLDIVWIDGMTIVDIAQNLQPDLAQSEAQLIPYSARLSSTLVLELPAGFTQKYGVKVGDIVKVVQ